MDSGTIRATEDEALSFHAGGRPGKLAIAPTKPLTTQRDLSLAYSPGVAFPCLQIEREPSSAFDYTSKGNFVAVVSNGTAVLGLGDLGALAAKPVMEGKAALFKRFADIDSIDLEIDTRDVDAFVNCVRYLHPAFGGINLEDIKAPECFIIEERLRELLDIPVFHDDQHGTAIIAAAGLINALHLTGRSLEQIRMVINGAGAASIACVELLKTMGLPAANVILCDTRGVIYRGRSDGMNQWKSAHAVETKARTLAEAIEGTHVFFGLSVKGAVDQAMVRSMADKPIVFAMANPDPEITPEAVRAVRSDAIIATGRSDYPNQVNNVLGFPYIFRGALDVRASAINDAMKIAAAEALAALAREDVPDEVAAAYSGERLTYGPDYIIPAPFDPRLIWAVPSAVAKAAMDSGVARKPIGDMAAYQRSLRGRLDPTAAGLEMIFNKVRASPRRVVFAEGEEEKTIRAALQFAGSGYGTPVLIGREERIKATMAAMGLNPLPSPPPPAGEGKVGALEIHNARLSHNNKKYTDFLYQQRQRDGMLYRDCQRQVNQDRNVFAACMVACGDADAMVSGVTRNSFDVLDEVSRVIEVRADCVMFGLTILLGRERPLLLADTLVHETPSPAQLADIANEAAAKAREFGLTPRVALLSYANFGNPTGPDCERVRKAVSLLDERRPDFEYDGEMSPDVALDPRLMRQLYPFCRLGGPANILVMPGLNSANITAKLLPHLGGGTVVGPLLMGLARPVQIVNIGATVSDLVNLAALAAHDAIH
jgi:malate dehydrogenase (oxaloacetate-decarboxylating)(NADP+)